MSTTTFPLAETQLWRRGRRHSWRHCHQRHRSEQRCALAYGLARMYVDEHLRELD